MITLNSEKGLIEVQDWTAILERPGFVVNLNPKEHKLKAIIGRYIFKDKIACGLSDCHTPHNKGYIVITNQGIETNIGKDCGAREFGVEFEALSKKFESDILAKNNREALATFSFGLDELEKQIRGLREGELGADSLHRRIQELIHPGNGWPDSVVTRVNAMARARNGQLSRSHVATEEERELIEIRDRRSLPEDHVIEEIIGEIQGLPAIYPENNLREILIMDLGNKLAEFRQLDIDCVSEFELRVWVRWINSVESLVARAHAAVASAKQLFRIGNLNQLIPLLSDRSDLATFRTCLKRLLSEKHS